MQTTKVDLGRMAHERHPPHTIARAPLAASCPRHPTPPQQPPIQMANCTCRQKKVCRVQWHWQGCHHSRSSCVHQQGATTITVVAVHQIWQHAAICIGQLRHCTSLVASYVCSQQLQGKAGCAFKAVHPVNTLSTLCRHNPTEQHLARNVRLPAAVVGPCLLA